MIKSTVGQFANSLGLNKDEYIPKEGASFSLFKIEILSGLTVAIALVPEAIAFAFVAGVAPLAGLYAAFIVGLITAFFGGRPGMISGATGALAVVMVSLVSEHGVQYLFATVILMGILQILAGIFRLGKFMRMVPQPVMLGFVNGLAIVIGLSHLHQFQIINLDGTYTWISGEVLTYSLVLVFLTMLIIWYLPRVTKIIPSTLAAILLVTSLVLLLDLPVPRVGDLSSVAGGLPTFVIPMVPINIETLIIIFPYAIILAAIGLIESLLTKYPQHIAGIKDSSGDWNNTQKMLDQKWDDFSIYAGSESFLLKTMQAGGSGCISATANINPKNIFDVYENWQLSDAFKMQKKIDAVRSVVQNYPLIPALKCIISHFHEDSTWNILRPPLMSLNHSDSKQLITELNTINFSLPKKNH